MPEPLAAPRPWVLRLYPRAWRARYGDELAALLAEQKLSPAILIDLLGGALDARLSPQKTTQEYGAEKMDTRMSTLCCSFGRPKPTVRQGTIGAATIILVSLLLAAAHLMLKKAYGPTPAIEAIQLSTFPAILLMSTSTIYLHGRSWRAQAAFVGFFLTIVYLISLGAAALS